MPPLRVRSVTVTAVLAMAVAAFWLTERTVLASLEWALYDWRTSYLSSPAQTHDDILVVAIDEATLKALPYQVPLERTFLADLVEAIRAGDPAVLGLDILLDRPTTPQADTRLAEALSAPGAPIVVAVEPRPSRPGQSAGSGNTNHNRAEIAGSDSWHTTLGAAIVRADPQLRSGREDRVIRRRGAKAQGALPLLSDAMVRAARPGPENTLGQKDRQLIPFGLDRSGNWPFGIMSAKDAVTLAKAGQVSWIKNKLILVGKVTPHDDRHPTPLRLRRPAKSEGRGAPGVIIHAYQVAQLLDGQVVAQPGVFWRGGFAVLAAGVGMGLSLGLVRPVRLALAATGIAALFVVMACVLYMATGAMVPVTGPVFAFAGAVFLAAALERHEERARRAWLKKSFSLYLAPAIVDQLVADPERLTLAVERREITVLFTDLEGFTAFIERHDEALPKDVLNRYFDVVLGVVFRHEGTVDKIVGDAVHAYFNAPLDQPDHSERAIACALEIAAETERLRAAISEEVGGFGRTRIGVHRGTASVGNFGNSRRFDYTAHGTTVNLASRLEQANKELGSQICASRAVRDHAPGFQYRDLGEITVRSIPHPVHVFEPIFGEQAAAPTTCSAAGAGSAAGARSEAGEDRDRGRKGHKTPQSSASAISSKLSVS